MHGDSVQESNGTSPSRMPAIPETRVRAQVSTMNSFCTKPLGAPIARIVPISAVRSKTDITRSSS